MLHLEITNRAWACHVQTPRNSVVTRIKRSSREWNVLSVCASSVEYSAKPEIGSYRIVSSIHSSYNIVVRGDCPHGLYTTTWELYTAVNPDCCRHKILCSSEVSRPILGTNKQRRLLYQVVYSVGRRRSICLFYISASLTIHIYARNTIY